MMNWLLYIVWAALGPGFMKQVHWTHLRCESSERKVLRVDRPDGRRVLKFDDLSGLRVMETAVAAVYSRLTAEKPNNRASPVEMHPFCLRHLPRRGRFALCLTFISYVMNRISEISRLQRFFPLWYLRHHLSPPAVRWDYNPPRSNHFISISRHSVARTSPSGGSSAAGGDRGAFPTPPGRFACFAFARQGGCMVLYKLAAQPPTTTL